MSREDGFPSAQELYEAGALANAAPALPSANQLLNDTGGPAPWSGGNEDFEVIPIEEDEEGSPERVHGQPAPITLMPTSTTNPARPRTLAAGYDKKLQTLSVIFRDGTLYNYYDVSPLQWSNFKRARSKGRFIRAYLDSHDRGYPSDTMSDMAQALISSVASEYQQAQGGLQPGHSANSKRGMRPYRR